MSDYVTLVKAGVTAQVRGTHIAHWAALGWTPVIDPADQFRALTIPALQEAADAAGIDLTGITRKADIIAALTAHAEAQAAAGENSGTPAGDNQ